MNIQLRRHALPSPLSAPRRVHERPWTGLRLGVLAQEQQRYQADVRERRLTGSSCSTSQAGRSLAHRSLTTRSFNQQTDDKAAASPDSAFGPSQRRQPPPPPPPQPPSRKRPPNGPPLWAVILFLLFGAGLWWSYIDSQTPQLSRDENGVQYLLTKGGNKLIVGEDPEGRVYFVDTNGNFYYDSGDPELGFYLVTRDDKVYNIFADESGQQQRIFVGTFQDLTSQKIKSLGGIPLKTLQKAYGKAFDGTITGFRSAAPAGKAPKAADFGGRPVPKAIVEYEPEVVVQTDNDGDSSQKK